MVITNRDLDLFRKLSIYGMLSTKQISSICFNSIALTTVLRRLRLLEENKYLQRILGLESQDVLWILSSKGAETASVEIPKRHWSKNMLEHDFKLLSLRLFLEGCGLAHSWMPEHSIRSNIFRKIGLRAGKEKLIPDGFMGTEAEGKRLSVAVELELTLKNKDKLRTTLSRYRRQEGILGVWYISPSVSLLNSLIPIWKGQEASSNGAKLYLSVLHEVMKNPLQAKVFYDGRGLETSSLWTPKAAHSPAQGVSIKNGNQEHYKREASSHNHAPNLKEAS